MHNARLMAGTVGRMASPGGPGIPVRLDPTSEKTSERGGARDVTLFFGGLVGLRELSEAIGEMEAARVASRLQTLQEIIVTRDGAGRVLPLGGDTIYAVFDSASEALNRALEVQRVLGASRYMAETGGRLRVRIGLHTGKVLEKEGERVEVVRRHVARARRVMEVASPGQILLSGGLVEAARDLVDVPRECVAIECFGEYTLRGVGAMTLCEVADLRVRKPKAPSWLEEEPAEPASIRRLELPGHRSLERLAEGTFGVVYRGEEEAGGNPVMLKVLHPALSEKETTRQRFGQELERLRKVTSAGIVKVIDERLDHEPPFLVMERVEGHPLDVALQGADPDRIAEVFRRICVILDRAHYAGIVHGDLKPGNVMVQSDDSPVLLDFGMTVMQGESQLGKMPVDTLLSAPGCLAPEQIRSGVARPESDVYALGVLLFKVLTGRDPFVGESVREVIEGHLLYDPPLPVTLRADVPDGLQRICLKALEKKPEDRYPAVWAMADDLARFIREETVRTRPSFYDNVLWHRARRHVDQVRAWMKEGLVNPEEHNRLLSAYEGLQRRGLPAVMEGRHHRLWRTLVYLGGWAVINGAVLWLIQHWDELSRVNRLILSSMPVVTAITLAAGMWRLGRFQLTFVALAVGVLTVPLMAGVWLYEFEVGAVVSEGRLSNELFAADSGSLAVTNLQLLLTALSAALAAGMVMSFTRTRTHSAQAMFALVLLHGACLLWWGLKPDVEGGRWAALALKQVPLLAMMTGVAWWLARRPDGHYQMAPWIWGGALLLIGMSHGIGWHGIEGWELFEEPVRPAISSLLMAGLGVGLVVIGQLSRGWLGHRCRGATWLVITAGLVTVWTGLWRAGQPGVWADGWWRADLFGAAVPAVHLLLPLASLGMALLACRFQMTTYLLVGLAGFAGSLSMLSLAYFSATAGWPQLVMILGVVGLGVALVIELNRNDNRALADVINRTRL